MTQLSACLSRSKKTQQGWEEVDVGINKITIVFKGRRGNLKICDKLEIFKVYLRYEKSCNDENL